MKRIYSVLITLFVFASFAQAQYVNIPDSNFRRYLKVRYPACFNASDMMDTTCSAIVNEPYLLCSSNSIYSLDGVQYMKSLKYIECDGNKLTTLPRLSKVLLELRCQNQQLTSLPALPSTLTYFACNNNQLTSLPALPNSITFFECGRNKLTSIPKLPTSLLYFHTNDNLLTSLPELPGSLLALTVDNNFNLNCLPVLPANLTTLNIDTSGLTTGIKCFPNSFKGYSSKLKKKFPICNPTNNSNNCTAFPYISGYVFYDTNKNGIKDVAEYYKVNAPVKMSNGATTFTNSKGFYEFTADNISAFTVTPDVPVFYTVVPQNKVFNFTSYDTTVTANFALQTNIVKDSLKISICPIMAAARPGFVYPYVIYYENTGTTTIDSSKLLFNYDSLLVIYDSSSNPLVKDSANQLSLTVTNLRPGEFGSFIAYCKIKSTTTLGTVISSMASITGKTAIGVDTLSVFARGSFDPNDKQATAQLTPQQVAQGKYILYTIRFQNTGTDTAFRVAIADTLDYYLKGNTMQVINTSHPCNIAVSNNNIIIFDFHNILLPDSNVNEPASHGYVFFKVQVDPLVFTGAMIPNKASIYFDYNKPVVTNTATTLIDDYIVSIPTYTFIGNGKWSSPANWTNNAVPPVNLQNGAQIIIDPAGSNECVLDRPQTISAGSTLTVKQGKKFNVNGYLIIK